MSARVPIRWRLTLWYALLFAATMVVFGAGTYAALQQRLLEAFDEQLADQAALLLSVIQTEAGDLAVSEQIDPGDDDLFVRVFDAEGNVVAGTTGALGEEVRRTRTVDAALRGRTAFSNVRLDREHLRLVAIPVRAAGGAIVGALQVGLSPDDVDEALREVASVLAIAAPLALLGAVGAGYVLAGRALRPVATITDLAASIGGDDLHARLDLPLPDDELGRLAGAFDLMLERIEDAFERQKRFTGDAAHELRTPLSLMRSQVDLALARPRSTAEYQEALRGLDGDLERLTGLVATLLTLARADAGRLAAERAPFDLADTVELVLEQYAPLATENQITLNGDAAPTPISADEDLLLQALVNLVDNALAHTPPGGTVAVGCRRNGVAAELWVTDTGEGIPLEHQSHVFDRFYRVDAGRSRERGGSGLGLAICAAIAKAHGGSISLTSAAGQGARVEMRIPATAA
jgi:heavy metal sensor kinase